MPNPPNPCPAPVARSADEGDAALVTAARRGDTAACYRIWSKYVPFVLRLVRAYFGPGAERDDLAQEVFMRVFSRIDELRDPNALRGFIAGVCLGVARNMSRRARVRGKARQSSDGDGCESERLEVPAPPHEDEARQVLRHLRRLLDAASAEDRSLFVARYVESLEMSEVAQAHQYSIGTAKRRISRMTRRMETAMKQDAVLAEYADKLFGKSRVGDRTGAIVR